MSRSGPKPAPIRRAAAARLLEYDPATGIFRWLVSRSRLAKAGATAGSIDSHGHRQIKISGRSILAHRLAWLFVYGEWPAFELDHRDLDRDNNRIANLRPATSIQNAQNRRCRTDSETGQKGIHRNGNSWAARIQLNGKRVALGTFPTMEEAAVAYDRAASIAFGEFHPTFRS